MTRNAVVTGGNSGVGLAVATALAKKGYAVWVTGRNAQKCATAVEVLRAAGAPKVEFLAADFGSFKEIENLVRTLKSQLGGRLDALVHSSGVLNSERKLTADGLEETWASQFVGRYLVTEGLLKTLEATENSRVVFIGAPLMGKVKLNEQDLTLDGQYAVFKSAQQAYLACQIYMERFATQHPNGPTINGGHVGLVSTGIARGVTGPMKFIINLMTSLTGISPERGAANFVAMASGPELEAVTGYFFPKPEKLAVRKPMQFSADQRAAFERVEAKYATMRQQVSA